MVQAVYNWGPLFAWSNYGFEWNNHNILTAIKCAKGVNLQILRYMNLKKNLDYLQSKLYETSNECVMEYLNLYKTKSVKKSIKISDVRYFGKGDVVDDEIKSCIPGLSSIGTKSFDKLVKKGCLYLTDKRNNERSNNFVAQLLTGDFIKMHKFIVDEAKQKEYVVFRKIETEQHHLSDGHTALKKIRHIKSDLEYDLIENLGYICVNFPIKNNEYVCPVPNLLHY